MIITGPSAHCVALGNLRTGYGYEAPAKPPLAGVRLGTEPWFGAPATSWLIKAASGTATLWSHRRERPGPDDTPGLSSPCYS